MKMHRQLGAIAPELGWLPTPRYLLRRARVLDLIQSLSSSSGKKLLEIGCGSGALLADLNLAGYEVNAVEESSEARAMATELTLGNVSIDQDFSQLTSQSFDWIMGLEVLEHIENDQAALNNWCEFLVPGGRALLSVPAHKKKWGISDQWAGHYRRYEKDEFISLIESAGMKLVHIENYGFPLANILEPIRNQKLKHSLQKQKDEGLDLESRSHQSGIRREILSGFERVYEIPFLLPKIMSVLDYGQKIFSSQDLGNGYLAVAQKG
ncbi:MAG: methyltransferase domain-containing protein [Myxococcota bacterium]|nr:methyltransferase domain-containing protein [Myxococcota bacterium]